MNFKDYLVKDLDVFINLEEFAEIHDINGNKYPASSIRIF